MAAAFRAVGLEEIFHRGVSPEPRHERPDLRTPLASRLRPTNENHRLVMA
jgi:hypothetical protein